MYVRARRSRLAAHRSSCWFVAQFRTFEVEDDPTGPPGGLWAEVSDGTHWIVVHFPADNVQDMHKQERKTLPNMVGGIVQLVPEAYRLERVPSRSSKLESRPSLALRVRMVTLVGAIGEAPHGRPTPLEDAEPAFKTWMKAVVGDERARRYVSLTAKIWWRGC